MASHVKLERNFTFLTTTRFVFSLTISINEHLDSTNPNMYDECGEPQEKRVW